MKVVLIAFILAHLPVTGYSLRRIDGTPKLHSVLDADTPGKAA
jgi:hypothetical protein